MHVPQIHGTDTRCIITTYKQIHLSIIMWQSQVEIAHYSVAYFDRITMFKDAAHNRTMNIPNVIFAKPTQSSATTEQT